MLKSFLLPLRTACFTSGVIAAAVLLTACPKVEPPETIDAHVDLEQYAGLWYEIASAPVFFNRNLVNVTATYTQNGDGTIGVVNEGFNTETQETERIEGTAFSVSENNSRLRVTFFEGPLALLFSGGYWIVDLDSEGYSWAVVSDRRRMTLFILSRQPTLDEDILDGILQRLEAQQFDTERLRYTVVQN